MAQLGGVRVILSSMECHIEDEEIQWHALQTLWRLALNELVRDVIVQEGGKEAIKNAMDAHPMNKKDIQFWGELTLTQLETPPDDYDESDQDHHVPEWLIDILIAILLVAFLRTLY
jgi:hypothetical protein